MVADITRFPFADASFDCVTCSYVPEHVPEMGVALAEPSRAMLPGTRMHKAFRAGGVRVELAKE